MSSIFSLYYFTSEPYFKTISNVNIIKNGDIILSLCDKIGEFTIILTKEKELYILMVQSQNDKRFEKQLKTHFYKKYNNIVSNI